MTADPGHADRPVLHTSGRWAGGTVLTWQRAYPGRREMASAARKLVACLLAGSGRGDDAEFVTAELVSNALLHTRSGMRDGWFGVQVVLGSVACVAVRDLGGGGVPVVSRNQQDVPWDELRENGRGLLTVARLARALGFDGDPATGHTVWAELDLTEGAGRLAPWAGTAAP